MITLRGAAWGEVGWGGVWWGEALAGPGRGEPAQGHGHLGQVVVKCGWVKSMLGLAPLLGFSNLLQGLRKDTWLRETAQASSREGHDLVIGHTSRESRLVTVGIRIFMVDGCSLHHERVWDLALRHTVGTGRILIEPP